MESWHVLIGMVLMWAVISTHANYGKINYGLFDGKRCVCDPSTTYGNKHPRPLYELFPGLGYYKLHTNSKNWFDAKYTCENEGAHLAVINSKKELEVLKELRRRLPNVIGSWEDDHCFIGISDIDHEGEWTTINDVKLENTGFHEWANSEPNGGTNENCGILITSQGKFNDAPCTVRRAFFCELEMKD